MCVHMHGHPCDTTSIGSSRVLIACVPADYDVLSDPSLPSRELVTLKAEAHANRRRIWNRGMSSESLRDYETILARRIAQLLERLEGLSASGAGAVDIAA